MTYGVEVEELGALAPRAPFVLPVTLLAGLGMATLADGVLCREPPTAIGLTAIVTFTWFGVALAVARRERYRLALLCLAPVAGVLVTLLFWLVTQAGGAWGIFFSIPVAFLMLLTVPPMLVLHAFQRRAGRARPGSMLKQSDSLRVWFAGLAILLFLQVAFAAGVTTLTPVRLAIFVITAGGLIIVAACDLLLARRLARAAAGAEPRSDERVDPEILRLDLGIGAERWFSNPHRGYAYRGAEKPGSVVVGALDWIWPLLRRRAAFSLGMAVLAGATLGCGVYGELTRPHVSITQENCPLCAVAAER